MNKAHARIIAKELKYNSTIDQIRELKQLHNFNADRENVYSNIKFLLTIANYLHLSDDEIKIISSLDDFINRDNPNA
jgi:hypothetical protein